MASETQYITGFPVTKKTVVAVFTRTFLDFFIKQGHEKDKCLE